LNRVFHYKRSILGYRHPYFWKKPYTPPDVKLRFACSMLGRKKFQKDIIPNGGETMKERKKTP